MRSSHASETERDGKMHVGLGLAQNCSLFGLRLATAARVSDAENMRERV